MHPSPGRPTVCASLWIQAIKVHRELGPGLLESAYRVCLVRELQCDGLELAIEHPMPVLYGGARLGCGYRLDIVVDDLVIVEIKSVAEISSIHVAQVLTYLKLTGYPLALLINFNVSRVAQGTRRVINRNPAERFLV
jgi:GxxExxY protein